MKIWILPVPLGVPSLPKVLEVLPQIGKLEKLRDTKRDTRATQRTP